MFGTEYNLVFFLHRVAYAEAPIMLEQIKGSAQIAAFEAAVSRGFLHTQHTQAGAVKLSLNECGLRFIGKSQESSTVSRWIRWAFRKKEAGAIAKHLR